jgi:hypothetical protein
MAYDTAANIIGTSAIECGLTSVVDPYSSALQEQIQLRTLLNQCGRELYAMYQWQQFVRSHTIDTGASPVADGLYDLPDDFGYFINQTGWTPTNVGLGLPLGGPLTQQQYTYLVATNLASSTIYVSFLFADGKMSVLPAPAPADIEITFRYISNAWVQVEGDPDDRATLAENPTDLVMFEPVLISKMLTARYKQAKGLDASASLQQFTTMFSLFTGVNQAAPMLSLVDWQGFPYINPWTNIPQTGFGS